MVVDLGLDLDLDGVLCFPTICVEKEKLLDRNGWEYDEEATGLPSRSTNKGMSKSISKPDQ